MQQWHLQIDKLIVRYYLLVTVTCVIVIRFVFKNKHFYSIVIGFNIKTYLQNYS